MVIKLIKIITCREEASLRGKKLFPHDFLFLLLPLSLFSFSFFLSLFLSFLSLSVMLPLLFLVNFLLYSVHSFPMCVSSFLPAQTVFHLFSLLFIPPSQSSSSSHTRGERGQEGETERERGKNRESERG